MCLARRDAACQHVCPLLPLARICCPGVPPRTLIRSKKKKLLIQQAEPLPFYLYHNVNKESREGKNGWQGMKQHHIKLGVIPCCRRRPSRNRHMMMRSDSG